MRSVMFCNVLKNIYISFSASHCLHNHTFMSFMTFQVFEVQLQQKFLLEEKPQQLIVYLSNPSHRHIYYISLIFSWVGKFTNYISSLSFFILFLSKAIKLRRYHLRKRPHILCRVRIKCYRELCDLLIYQEKC